MRSSDSQISPAATSLSRRSLPLALAAAVLLAGAGLGTPAMAQPAEETQTGAVFVMTNDATGNQVIAYKRRANGTLVQAETYDTNGLGTSRIRLSSQGSVVLTPDGRWLLVANVGSSDISVFAVNDTQLQLVDVVDSHGETPNSITVRGNLVYVLNNGGAGMGNIAGFRLRETGQLAFIQGSIRTMSAAGSDPAQVAFTPDGGALVVTEKATNKIDVFPVVNGLAGTITVHESAGVTPFGLDFTQAGVFVVTNATNGDIGKATASSYVVTGSNRRQLRTISGALGDRRSEVCWTIITKDERFAYVTNFGDGTISTYRIAPDGSLTLHDPIAATTTFGQLSIRDGARTPDGRYLYAIDITAQKVFGWTIRADGGLNPLGASGGVPTTVAGIAVR